MVYNLTMIRHFVSYLVLHLVRHAAVKWVKRILACVLAQIILISEENGAVYLDGCVKVSKRSSSEKLSPLHGESIGHLLHSVVLRMQQLFGSFFSHTVEPRLVQLSYTSVIFWRKRALCHVKLLNFLEQLLLSLTSWSLYLPTTIQTP